MVQTGDKLTAKILGFLEDKPKYVEVLKNVVEYEVSNPDDIYGFLWSDVVGGSPARLNKLVTEGILKIPARTRTSTYYKLTDLDATRRALGTFRPEVPGGEVLEEERIEVKPDLFDVVVGYDSVKSVMARGLRSERPVHFLLYGAPATAKSLMVDCVRTLPNSVLVLGSSLTKVGIRDVLMDNPRRNIVLCLDEIEKVDNPRDLDILLRIMQTGEIVKTIHGTHEEVRKRVQIVATANRIGRLSPELRSRFAVFRFREYTDEEFVEVSKRVLTKFEGANEEIAAHIAGRVLRELESRDVRDCVKVWRLGGENKEQIDEVIGTLRKYR